MALQNPCTGQELVQEINDMQEFASAHSQHTDNRLDNLETDGFHIGDIRHSSRDDLGEKYLLCNGDYIWSYDGYEELTDIMLKNGRSWHKEINTLSSPLPWDGDTAIERICHEIDGDVIYQVLSGNGLYLRKYDNCFDFIKGEYSKEVCITTERRSVSGVKKFKNHLFVITSSSLYSATLDNLDVWEMVLSDGAQIGAYGCSDNRFLFVDAYSTTKVNPYETRVRCTTTTDGTTFTQQEIKLPIYIEDPSTRLKFYQCIFQNNTWVLQYYNYDKNKAFFIHNDDSMSNDWVLEEIPLERVSDMSPVVYYGEYYWYYVSQGSSISKHYVYRSKNLKSWSTVVSANTAVDGALFVKNSKLFYSCGTNYVVVYDDDKEVFVSADKTTLRQCGVTITSYSSSNENGRFRYETQPSLENEDFYMTSYAPVSTADVPTSKYDIMIVPKTFTVSTVPTISESSSYYTYIKAKE